MNQIEKMKKIPFTIASLSLFIIGCSSTPQDACECIQNAANDFMIQGVQIETIDDLREPCKDVIDKFKEDAAARALIVETGNGVFEHLKNKELIQIEGEDLPQFPKYTFQTLGEFIDATKKEGGIYKYWRTEVTINDAYLGPMEDETNDVFGYSGFAESISDVTGKSIGIRFPKDMVKPDFVKSIELPSYYGLFDSKTGNFIKEDTYSNLKGNIRDVIEHQLQYPNGDGYVETHYRDQLMSILKTPGYENFIADLKNGRYLWLSEDDIRTLNNNDFKGKSIKCLTNVSFVGTVNYNSHEWLYIDVDKLNNTKNDPLPKIFENRSHIDLSRIHNLTEEPIYYGY